ncbi:MAG: cardiolipin synthase [Desulfonatronovibrionaceae bacterium]
MLGSDVFAFFAFLFPFVEGLAIVAAIHAIMKARTSQGAIAWAVSLVTFPWVVLPLYAIFGRSRFNGYVLLRTSKDLEVRRRVDSLRKMARASGMVCTDGHQSQKALSNMADLPLLGGNKSELLIDGKNTFAAIFSAINNAKEYLLIQFFIVRDDELGGQLKDLLLARAKQGVRIYFLYDEIGSHSLSRGYLAQLRNAGIEVSAFHTTKGRANRFQLNFRNHRKIVIADGEVAFVGGHNVGDEYVSRHSRFGAWRDTHVKVQGPVVNAIQFAFLEDWFWTKGEIPDLNWNFSVTYPGDEKHLLVASGPADPLETCGLMFTQVINDAKERIWIASPYFVPDPRVVGALKLAALRGVDVSILIPQQADHLILYLASFAYYQEILAAGIKIFRYDRGFLHQKVFLVDSACAAVGTANLDNRSFHLNFELMLLNYSADFIAEVEEMLARDFSGSRRAEVSDYTSRSFPFRLAVRSSALLSPVL